MKYGFLIDQRKCIGCHACTVACKQENEVPLGVFRTWVKYIEKGSFPDTTRRFSVLRCNHCDDAPCIAICPTQALFKRDNGIVDFDSSRCIGCKACMQACPYDALYIDPVTETAAKCNFCAHRVDVGLKPACEIVCPTQAILSGDLDDPHSRISQLVSREPVQVRKPEQGTLPKLFYIDGDSVALTPTASPPQRTYMWAESKPTGAEGDYLAEAETVARARTVYNVSHPRPWGFMVSLYLWTKSIGAGALLCAAILWALGHTNTSLLGLAAALLALLFIGVTTALLVLDLKHPERFHYILLKPNWTSWLVWGAYILIAFSAFALLWGAAAWLQSSLLTWLIAPVIVLAIGAAGYTGFLFGQAEGRDFWQSPLLPAHLVAEALLAGSASLFLIGLSVSPALAAPLTSVLLIGLGLHAAAMLAEVTVPHANAEAATAARLVRRGPFRERFWLGTVTGGVAIPAALALLGLVMGALAVTALGSVLALAGLLLWQDVFVKAGQAVPLS